MTKHDRNWIFVLLGLVVLLVVGPCMMTKADESEHASITCEQNAEHIKTAKSEIKGIDTRFKAATTDEQRLVIGTEGEFMMKMLTMLKHWRDVNHCDI